MRLSSVHVLFQIIQRRLSLQGGGIPRPPIPPVPLPPPPPMDPIAAATAAAAALAAGLAMGSRQSKWGPPSLGGPPGGGGGMAAGLPPSGSVAQARAEVAFPPGGAHPHLPPQRKREFDLEEELANAVKRAKQRQQE